MTGGRWDRIAGIVDREAVASASVLIAGLGSGGSTVALELAKAGVGRFTLIDNDVLEDPNIPRHECDDRYLGRNKAEAVAELIAHRNAEAEVEALGADLFALGPLLTRLVSESDIVAVCLDSEPPKHLLNVTCTATATPAVYAGVYSHGKGGEIIRCLGRDEDPCYACTMSVLKEAAPIAAEEDELDYGAVDATGAIHGAPGLGIDVRMIALIHAKVCLATLLDMLAHKNGGPPPALAPLPADVVLFGNEAVQGLFPRALSSAFVRIARQEGCLVCGPLRQTASS